MRLAFLPNPSPYPDMTNLLPYTARLTLEGPDTIGFLERLITCHVDDMSAGAARPGALLTPQGKIIADFLATRTDEGCTLDTSPLIAATLEKRLKLFRLRAEISIERTDLPNPSYDDTTRIAAGRAAFGHDFHEAEVFPTDINLDLLGGIDYKKGCFVGQEVVSRMKRRGKIRKRTVSLSSGGTGSELIPGDDIQAGDRKLGRITSAAGTMALALVRIDHLAPALASNTPLIAGVATVTPDTPDWLIAEMEALTDNADT